MASTHIRRPNAGASSADASTIYACVKKSGGAARIVSKGVKCKKGESKLSWNTTGPAGKTGATGAAGKEGSAGKEGTPGKNGAVAGYSATQSSPVEVEGPNTLLVSKVLPAGSYLVSAKSLIRAIEGTTPGFLGVACEIWDESSETTLDESEVAGGLGEYSSGKFGGAWSLPLQAAVSSGSKIEVQVWCRPTANITGAKVVSFGTQLAALQTSSNS